ncbi:GNAT family protein [Mucilaginibacter panaciglaebae]|uniref:N-acetyltransferase domain-containing protein n=1 Tax=Mucilaginibacter panaciglaebae TaxID=502331 RepID=A0ABP7WGA7_9SPHI
MKLKIIKTSLAQVQPFRDLFLAESRFQFVYNKCHGAGWADTYLFTIDETPIGYGSVWGKNNRADRDAIFEYYLLKPFRKFTDKVFPEFQQVSGAPFIECQSNDTQLAGILFEYTKNIYAEAILFEADFETNFEIQGTIFRRDESKEGEDRYVIEHNGEVVADGGYVWNYNFPYIDMYYEVKENKRQQGFGSLITQELKKEAYRLNRVPAARCNINNKASKATLLKAGMRICGHILIGEFK